MGNQNGNESVYGIGQKVEHGVPAQAVSSKRIPFGLKCGVIAGPLYMLLGLLQVLTRDGFDIRRHALSLLSNGDLGWIQITNFLVSAVLVLAFASSAKRMLAHSRGGKWGSLLIGGYGIGLIGAGLFVADPAFGFPVGAPAGSLEHASLSGFLHFASGGIGFICLIMACFVFARRFSSLNQKGWGLYSILTGVLFLAGFIGIASGTVHPAINISFTIAVVLGWVWISLIALNLHKYAK